MRTTVLFLTCLIFLIQSCKDLKSNQQREAIKQRIETELASGKRYDTIFLGLTFGMSEKEFTSELSKLVRAGKLYVNSSDQYEYKFEFKGGTYESAKANLNSEFHSDSLFQLTLIVEPEISFGSRDLIKLKLINLYIDKYFAATLEKESLLGEHDDYVIIKGNLQIEILTSINGAHVIYTDLSKEKEINRLEQIEAREKAKSNISDI